MTMADNKNSVIEHKKLADRLIRHLKSGEAFMPIENLLQQITYEQSGVSIDDVPYTVYQLLNHLRFAQLDIIKYCRDSDYSEPEWPADYWPDRSAPVDQDEWRVLVDNFIKERDEFCELISESSAKLFDEVKPDTGHTLLRQTLLLIEHNAYHIGQLYVLSRFF